MERAYRAHLLICAGTSCTASGSLDVRDALVAEIEKRGLENEIYVTTTGCNGFCAAGPLLVAYPDAIFYQKLKVADVPHFVEEYLVKGRVVKELPIFEDGVISAGVRAAGDAPLYARSGDLPVLALLVLVVAASLTFGRSFSPVKNS